MAVRSGGWRRWAAPEGLALLRAWALMGLDDGEIAGRCGVAASTLDGWRRRHPEIDGALAWGRGGADADVEAALHSLAVGYVKPVRRTYKLKQVEFDERGRKAREWEELETGMEDVHVAPNVTAQKFWLASRMPGRWGERRALAEGDGAEEIICDIPRPEDGGDEDRPERGEADG